MVIILSICASIINLVVLLVTILSLYIYGIDCEELSGLVDDIFIIEIMIIDLVRKMYCV